MLLSVGVWCALYGLEIGLADIGLKILVARLEYVGIVALPVFWALFALRFTGFGVEITWRRIALLCVVPTVTLGVVTLGDPGGLMWSSVAAPAPDSVAALAISHGLLFWVYWAYSYMLLLGGVALLVRAALRYPRHYREQVRLIILAVAVPWLANAVYAIGLAPSQNIDLTPFAFTITGAVIALALSRHRFLNIFLGLQSRARGAIFDTMPDGVVVLDRVDRVIDCNPAASALLGDDLGRFIEEQIAEFCLAAAQDAEPGPIPAAGKVQREVQFSTGAEIKTLDVVVTSLGADPGGRSGSLVVIHDITQRRRAEQAALESERRYRELVDNAHDLIVTTDKDGRITGVNTASVNASGFTREELIGRTFTELGGVEQQPRFADPDLTLNGQRREIRLRSRAGREITLEASVRGVFHGGELAGYECIARDVTESRQWEEALRFQALHDNVTNLPNRMHFRERIAELLADADRDPGCFAVYVLDLDQFKHVNDSLGHQTGDSLLEVVARRLKGTIRAADTVARMGGDEFSLVVGVVDMDDARRVGQRICEVFREPFKVEGTDLPMSASVGIAVFPDHGSTVDCLIKFADIAMYAAKKAGGARFAIYSVGNDHHCADRLTLQADLRAAFENDELTLHYQPLIDLRRGGVASVEALVRWNHPRRGLILPFEFLDVLERDGLTDRLADWALDKALGQAARWRRRGLRNRVSVNLSARNLDDPDLPLTIAGLLAKHNARADWMTVELTEGSILLDPERNTRTLSAIRDLGVRVSIDDYGAGQSSLTYLKRLPADEVKIDKSFVLTMTVDKHDAAIVRSTIGLAHELGLSVVGEGIENEATLRLLRGYGCDLGQGYYLGRPEGLRAASRRLRASLAEQSELSGTTALDAV